ncbi:hypothetical protein H257_05559 [Aphanomyces astaci]|uniref:Uncharacterized protein n=1 Tax=Aphanomyces astaci TaxID=112090 RepID=W4GQQ3_APHAT|nr:hypothetical protein H257_05559 [Aphanomyces astaci]ETV82032.1 hypothetical protein H257_05559 [Aphanomyces astaci]|eukprot:XP_009828769.1 hypothetical protein H257_05559 [Aphanomyces astaci]
MAAGQLMKSLNEDATHDNQSTADGAILVNVIKCERDLKNCVVCWGVARSHHHVRVFVDGSPHALDGFYLDIPTDLQGQLDERLLFEAMPRLEPHFLWGSYNSVSATSSLAGARYRLHFLGSDIPSSMLVGDRMVEEFVFRGRCLRVYGRGRFFRDHQLVRINLDGPTPPDNLA